MEITMHHLLIPLGIFLVFALGLAVASRKVYKAYQNKVRDEREEAGRRHEEIKKFLVDAERQRSLRATPKLFLRYEHASSEFESFSGLTVGNHGEPAYGVRMESERRGGLQVQFHNQGIILDTNQLRRIELTVVSSEYDSARKFSVAKGWQLSALFDKLNQMGEEEKIAVTIHCEDYQRKPLEFNWCIRRDLGNISCDRLP
jgi:hypothetical protein